MVIYIVWSLLICLLGLIIYYVTCSHTDPAPSVFESKSNVIGLHMFWVGLLAFLMQVGGRAVFGVK